MLFWAIIGVLVICAVLFSPSWKGGRAAFQGGWGGSVMFLILALIFLLFIWRGAR